MARAETARARVTGCPPAGGSLGERVRARGWRMTAQRTAIVAALDEAHGHVTAEAVHVAVRRAGARASLATVYNTLTALVAMGEIREVHASRGAAYFDFNVEPHHHLVCDGCGRLVDIEPGVADGVRLARRMAHGYRLYGVDIVFHGRCPACAGR